jgi:hypothetical protein
MFGFEMVLLSARWDRFRVPVALALIDPQCRGHQNILFRQMLKTFIPPAWVKQVVVVADVGFAANATRPLMTEPHDANVFAVPRTRKLTNGRYLRDLVQHLPKRCDDRRASHKPGGRRRDDWVLTRHATRQQLGDVTMVLSKPRRHDGSKGVKILVTNLHPASAGAILSIYAWRWGVQLVFKRMKQLLRLNQLRSQHPTSVEATVRVLLIAWVLHDGMAAEIRAVLATLPHAGPREVSRWLLTGLGLETVRQQVLRSRSQTQLLSCLPRLQRFLTRSPRRRPHQETEVRACISTPDFRTREITRVTTLLDADLSRVADLAVLVPPALAGGDLSRSAEDHDEDGRVTPQNNAGC